MPTALVTGGHGFIGSALVAKLLARGTSVRVLDTASPSHLPSDVDFLRGSILDAEALAAAMAGADEVYHLAAIAHLWVRDKAAHMRINADGTRMVLDAARKHGIARLVHCSTEAILMPKDRAHDAPVREDDAPPFEHMPGPYTRSKHIAEQAALAAARAGLDVRVVNPTVPIGAGDTNMTPPAAMLAMFLKGKAPAFLDCTLNLVDVRDVAAGMILAAERGRAGERYILGGENLTLRALLRQLETSSGRRMPTRALPAALALAAAAAAEWTADHVTGRTPAATQEGVRLALRSAPLDSGKAARELGYAPRPIAEVLGETVRWLLSRRT